MRLSSALVYGAPPLGFGFLFFLVSLYLMKYSTDVLLVSPVAMGVIFGLSRVWDAVTDPLAGYLSDRTRSRLGRRRPWLLAATVPIVVTNLLMWNPPAGLGGGALVAWMAVAIFGFYSAMTILIVPHVSLGAELSRDRRERTRLFGIRHICWSTGSLLSLVAMYLLIRSEAPRDTALRISSIASAITAILILFAVARLREPPEYLGRGAQRPYAAFRDVLTNPHQARLLTAIFIEYFGIASITIMTPYVVHYIVKRPNLTPAFIACYVLPSLLSVPLWVRASRRISSKRLWIFAMLLSGASFGGMFFMAEGTIMLVAVLTTLGGVGGGCGSVVGPAIQADVIDDDEAKTGQRKEGAYFAAYNFAMKSATGLTLMLAGFVLSWTGFQPNAEQSDLVKLALRTQFALFPLACYAAGAACLARFTLDGKAETEVDGRRAPARRAAPEDGGGPRPGSTAGRAA